MLSLKGKYKSYFGRIKENSNTGQQTDGDGCGPPCLPPGYRAGQEQQLRGDTLSLTAGQAAQVSRLDQFLHPLISEAV